MPSKQNFTHRVSAETQQMNYSSAKKWVKDHLKSNTQFKRDARFAVLIVGLVTVIMTIGIYGLGWQNRLVRNAAVLIPFPAATIDGQVIGYDDYVSRLIYLRSIQAFKTEVEVSDIPLSLALSQQAMESLIKQRIIIDETASLNLSVSDAEVSAIVDNLFSPLDNPLDLLENKYGITRSELSELVYVGLLQTKLEATLRQNNNIDQQTSIVEWLDRQKNDRSVKYLLPQHNLVLQ